MSASMIQFADSRDTEGSIPNLLARLMLGIIGSALVFSAFGLWLVPGAGNLPELTLIKMALSLFMLIGGMCCMVISRKPKT